MFLMRFTERAYYHYTEEDVRNSYRSAVRLTFPNSHFDTAKASHMYNYYLDEYEYSEEVGFDGLMLNEHHNTPTCMGAAMNLEAAILARITKKPKIVLLGNPLPIQENPIRMAEELAEIDLISRGRLVSGFVRGTGVESWATNTNPCLQPRPLPGSPRSHHQDLDHARPLPMGGQALRVPRGQSIRAPAARAAPTRLGSRQRKP